MLTDEEKKQRNAACFKAWYLANQEKQKARSRAQYLANPEKQKARQRAQYLANPEKYKARQRAQYLANPEKRKAIDRNYYLKNGGALNQARYTLNVFQQLAMTVKAMNNFSHENNEYSK